MKTIIFCFLLFFNIPNIKNAEKNQPFSRGQIIDYIAGVRKPSKELVDKFTEERIRASYFYMLRDPVSIDAPLNILRYEKYFKEAADSFGIRKEVLMSIAFSESFGRDSVKSHAGAVGIMQIMPRTATDLGLKNGYSFVTKNGKKKRTYDKSKDERYNPKKSIFAAAKYLARMKKRFGREDLIIASYHMGQGNLAKVLGFAQLENVPLDFPSIYFYATGDTRLGKFLNSLDDHSKSYLFGIRASEYLLSLSKESFLRLYFSNRNNVREEKSPYRFYTWLCVSDAYECVDQIISTKEDNNLVKIPKSGVGVFKTDSLFSNKHTGFDSDVFFYTQPEVFGFLIFMDLVIKRRFVKSIPKSQILSLTEALECDKKYVFNKEIPVTCFGRSVVITPPEDKLQAKVFDEMIFSIANVGWISRAIDKKGNYVVVVSKEDTPREFFADIWKDTYSVK